MLNRAVCAATSSSGRRDCQPDADCQVVSHAAMLLFMGSLAFLFIAGFVVSVGGSCYFGIRLLGSLAPA